VSTLWAVADPAVAPVIERADQAAVKEALAFIEKHALFTGTGPQGIRQVNVRGLVAAAFTHWEQPGRGPDLHTHVAVANKVQTLDGRWLSIDGRLLFKANVAASETYNTALEQHLHETWGCGRRTARHRPRRSGRSGRSSVSTHGRANAGRPGGPTSTSAAATSRSSSSKIMADHRPRVEALHLAQQATLETRDAKHEPRSLAEQRATWFGEAAAVLRSSEAVASMVQTALAPHAETTTIADSHWVAQTADHILTVMKKGPLHLEMAANGAVLDVGQAALVRQMCSSGARVQLAIAAAGAGKTTAMHALTQAWTEDGGQVIGLAPSAAAAAVLAEQTNIRTDTLAKLIWSLDHGDLPDWAAVVGRSTLLIIDEAGMADTLSLDAAVHFAIDRGASVRLVGNDQQLAAIGRRCASRHQTDPRCAVPRRAAPLHRPGRSGRRRTPDRR